MLLTYEAGRPVGVLGVALHMVLWFIPLLVLTPYGSELSSALTSVWPQ